ncbi:hypothetical protein [Caballeronia sp. RCC_10]|uniref:hypothetical protein n=1 Tax=Caballeronia sp. RCC_10 TaxID=3239227 RepID=UPI003524B8DF
MSQIKRWNYRCGIVLTGLITLSACSFPMSSHANTQTFDGNNAMISSQPPGMSANQTGIPDDRIRWVKNALITRIEFVDGVVRDDSIKIRYNLSMENPTNAEIKSTGRPTPDDGRIRLFLNGRQIDPTEPPTPGQLSGSQAPPRDEEIRLYRQTNKAHNTWKGDVPADFVIADSRLISGTNVYEIVYWQTQLDWIDVREVLQRTDAQGKGRMLYPLTDNAPSNRLYFKVYKPTDEEAAKGRKIEFLGEVDAKTQGPAFPYARPGDFAPKTGYWQAVGKPIEAIGGYHEVFRKEGMSMPNLPGDVGVDPFGFQWKYVGEQSGALRK